MRVRALSGSLAIALLLPAVAIAQKTCQERAANRAAGTIAGVAAGALIGSAVAGEHNRAAGAVVGGIAGGVVGNQLTKGPPDCAHAYGWYDDDGVWHATDVSPSDAYGYYDRNGAWIEGTPPGYDDRQPPTLYGDQRGGYAEQREPRYGDQQGPRYGEQDQAWSGYPQFRSFEDRIQANIRGDVANDLIEPDDARDLIHQLGDIQVQEAAEYRAHGWDLPYDAQQRIRYELRELDRSVDEISQQP